MFYFLLSFLFIFRTTFGDNDPCKDATIDAMNRVKHEATNEIYIYSGEYYYTFNVETRELDIEGGTKIKDTWPEVEPPITGAAIFLPNPEENYVAFAKANKIWLYPIPSIKEAAGKKLVDLKKDGPTIGRTSQHIEAMRWNSNAKDEFKIRICYNRQPNDCNFSLQDLNSILPECNQLNKKDKVTDCRAVTSALYYGEEILLIAFAEELHYFTKEETPQKQQVLNIKEDVFGCKSMLLALSLIVLVVGVVFLLLSLIPLIIVLVIRRGKVRAMASQLNEDTSVVSRTGVKSKPSVAASLAFKNPKARTK